ncbi:hypothetical protein Poly51_63120 [Rubripirellula tenax]|uniref:Uncharacterized protein n=1 Tax=Rubripirellula tenax TaxID=2528015 RepID=A0A5C6E447_9BACT|nr:hypothetical protein [Rubripirellula tenax]TWU43590.1 hypothetical protein Poly51_63120 [Rubripirellula tenax]
MRIQPFSKTCVALLVLFSAGCNSKPTDQASSSSNQTETKDVHAHPSEGPHHGTLVELGNEEYHGEVVHDDKSVTVYVLDSGAGKNVPIDASEVTINLLHDGTPEQFKLLASPEEGDPSGKASRFTLADADLAGHIDDTSSAPKLMLTIGGTAYRGEIKHDHGHDHEGHDHAGHDH